MKTINMDGYTVYKHKVNMDHYLSVRQELLTVNQGFPSLAAYSVWATVDVRSLYAAGG